MFAPCLQAQLLPPCPPPEDLPGFVPASVFIRINVPAGLHANHWGDRAEEGSPIKPLLEDLEPKMFVLPMCFALVSFQSFFFFFLT